MLKLDRVYNADVKAACDTIIGMVQTVGCRPRERAENVVLGAAILLIEVCRRYNLHVRIVLDCAERVYRDAKEKRPPEMRAFIRTLKEELPDE